MKAIEDLIYIEDDTIAVDMPPEYCMEASIVDAPGGKRNLLINNTETGHCIVLIMEPAQIAVLLRACAAFIAES